MLRSIISITNSSCSLESANRCHLSVRCNRALTNVQRTLCRQGSQLHASRGEKPLRLLILVFADVRSCIQLHIGLVPSPHFDIEGLVCGSKCCPVDHCG